MQLDASDFIALAALLITGCGWYFTYRSLRRLEYAQQRAEQERAARRELASARLAHMDDVERWLEQAIHHARRVSQAPNDESNLERVREWQDQATALIEIARQYDPIRLTGGYQEIWDPNSAEPPRDLPQLIAAIESIVFVFIKNVRLGDSEKATVIYRGLTTYQKAAYYAVARVRRIPDAELVD